MPAKYICLACGKEYYSAYEDGEWVCRECGGS